MRTEADLTYSNVAEAAGVQERTVFRHFPTKADLETGLWDWIIQNLTFADFRARNEDFLNFIRQVGELATDRTQPPDQPLDFDMLYRVVAETGQPVIGPPMTEDEAAKIVVTAQQ